MTPSSARIEMIPIGDIAVANPRVRNAKIHKTITDSIDQVGLKRPITVRRIPPGQGSAPYALICGQGRLESCKMLGQTEIAALIVDVDEETGHVMSIVENVARRTPRAAETLEQVRSRAIPPDHWSSPCRTICSLLSIPSLPFPLLLPCSFAM